MVNIGFLVEAGILAVMVVIFGTIALRLVIDMYRLQNERQISLISKVGRPLVLLAIILMGVNIVDYQTVFHIYPATFTFFISININFCLLYTYCIWVFELFAIRALTLGHRSSRIPMNVGLALTGIGHILTFSMSLAEIFTNQRVLTPICIIISEGMALFYVAVYWVGLFRLRKLLNQHEKQIAATTSVKPKSVSLTRMTIVGVGLLLAMIGGCAATSSSIAPALKDPTNRTPAPPPDPSKYTLNLGALVEWMTIIIFLWFNHGITAEKSRSGSHDNSSNPGGTKVSQNKQIKKIKGKGRFGDRAAGMGTSRRNDKVERTREQESVLDHSKQSGLSSDPGPTSQNNSDNPGHQPLKDDLNQIVIMPTPLSKE